MQLWKCFLKVIGFIWKYYFTVCIITVCKTMFCNFQYKHPPSKKAFSYSVRKPVTEPEPLTQVQGRKHHYMLESFAKIPQQFVL